MIRVGMESLLRTLCYPNLAEVQVQDEDKEEMLKDLQSSFVYGTLLCKSSPGFCDWFGHIMVELLLEDSLSSK